MRPGGIHFGQHANIQLLAYFQSGTHPRKTSTDNHYIMLNHKITLSKFPVSPFSN